MQPVSGLLLFSLSVILGCVYNTNSGCKKTIHKMRIVITDFHREDQLSTSPFFRRFWQHSMKNTHRKTLGPPYLFHA